MNSKHEVNYKVQVNEKGQSAKFLKPVIKSGVWRRSAPAQRARWRPAWFPWKRAWAPPRKPRRRGLPGGSADRRPRAWPWRLSRGQGITLGGSAEIVAEIVQRLCKCSVQKLVLVFSSTESGEVLERWRFEVECDKTAKDGRAPREKSQELSKTKSVQRPDRSQLQ